MRNLITAQEVIELAFAENSNMMAESISDTAIRIAEIKYIRPAFGVMYPLLADKYADFTNDYVKPALAYFVKCEIVSSIAIDMSNSGVAVANPQYQSAATDKQRQRLYDSEMSKAKTLLDFALEYIATHSESFPDFSGEAPKKHHRVGGILLGGGTSRSQSASIAGEAFKNEFERLSKKVANKVDKVEGKGLSTNDYTNEDKAKVNDIGDNTIIVDYDRIAELKASEENDDVRHPEIAELVEKIYNEQDKLILVRHFWEPHEQLDPTYFVPDTNYSRDEFGNVIITLFASYTPTYNTYGEQSLHNLEISITQAGAILKVEQKRVTLLNDESVIDNLNNSYSKKPLSARQGRELDRKKQDKLTLSTKENGNIEISGLSSEPVMFMPATPSGDPMHDMYVENGAIYNASASDKTVVSELYGDSITHKAGCWFLNDLGDLTTKEIRAIYNERYASVGPNDLLVFWRNSIQRTNMCNCRYGQVANMEITFGGAALENARLSYSNIACAPNRINSLFRACQKLKRVVNIINAQYLTNANTVEAFLNCTQLQDVRISNLKADLSFGQSERLTKESLLHMIENCASNATFTITLHSDVYAKCQEGGEWFDDVDYRLARANDLSNTIITLASA